MNFDMTIRALTPDYAVSPQITADDIAEIAAAGYTTIICNRPDGEVTPDLAAQAIGAAAESAGLTFVENPFSHQNFHVGLIDQQAAAIDAASGPVFAYCASGNRSSVLWAMAMVRAGSATPEQVVSAAAAHGYDLSGLAPQLASLAP